MKKYRFLLLDAGPIIKLFSLDIWDEFVKRCEVTLSRAVKDQALYTEDGTKHIDLKPYEEQVRIIDVKPSLVKTFHDKFNLTYKADIHAGEKETLAFMHNSSEDWKVCSTDGAVFRVLGLLGKGQQGLSLEEVLKDIGLPQSSLEWIYTKRFREKFTRMGQMDSIQGQGVL